MSDKFYLTRWFLIYTTLVRRVLTWPLNSVLMPISKGKITERLIVCHNPLHLQLLRTLYFDGNIIYCVFSHLILIILQMIGDIIIPRSFSITNVLLYCYLYGWYGLSKVESILHFEFTDTCFPKCIKWTCFYHFSGIATLVPLATHSC